MPLAGEDRAASLARGGDGQAALFRGGWLNAGQGADGEPRLSGKTMNLLLRDPEVFHDPGTNRFHMLVTARFTGGKRIYVSWLADGGWGGDLIFRELIQNSDGTLGTRFVPELTPASDRPLKYSWEVESGEVATDRDSVSLEPSGRPTATPLGLPANAHVRFRASAGGRPGQTGGFGVRLSTGAGGKPACELRIEPHERKVSLGKEAIPFQSPEGLDRPIPVDLILKYDIVDACLDNRNTLVGQRVSGARDRLVFFTEGIHVTFSQIEVRPLAKKHARVYHQPHRRKWPRSPAGGPCSRRNDMIVRRSLVLGMALLPCVLTACKQSGDQGSTQPETAASKPVTASRGTIGLSVLTLTNPFFKELADSFSGEVAGHGYEAIVVSGELDAARQGNQVKDFIVRKVAAIVLTPCDSKSIGPVIQEANQAGIPVFTADIACLDPAAKVVTHVATDNHGGGIEAAVAMIEAIGGKGKVAIVHHPEVESAMMRVRGFEERIAQENEKAGGGIQIVARLPGYGARERSFRVAQDLVQAHPDLGGIFAVNDPSALGVRAALENAGKADQIKIIGFDGQPEGKKAIREGKIYADPIQFPDRIGREVAQAIVKHFAGETVPPEILIPTALYRQRDAEADPAIR
ncbi:MAG TPA: substrate-binding domain-containing protein [Phycisphaerae bacterium]|nr:substrate-binding domain-containing protein [Phycisphaerae bacterium]HSA28580.1 substrate-binding domain-containing protein [Phycisphaerae bacterium]